MRLADLLPIDPELRAIARGWLLDAGGDRERVAAFMAGGLRLGAVEECRAFLELLLAPSAPLPSPTDGAPPLS